MIDPAKVLPEPVSKAARRCGLESAEIKGNSHRPATVRARALVSYVAICGCGLNPTVVARHLGVSRYSVLRGFQRAQQLRLDSDAEALAKQISHRPLASA